MAPNIAVIAWDPKHLVNILCPKFKNFVLGENNCAASSPGLQALSFKFSLCSIGSCPRESPGIESSLEGMAPLLPRQSRRCALQHLLLCLLLFSSQTKKDRREYK